MDRHHDVGVGLRAPHFEAVLASQAGIDAFLGKPISFDRLERALADVGVAERV